MYSVRFKKAAFLLTVILCYAFTSGHYLFALEPSEFRDIYTVKRGDTLYEIALLHNTTPELIAEENTLENPDLIHPGQKLSIPVDRSNYLGGGFSFTPEPIRGYREADKISGYRFVNDSKLVGSWYHVGTCTSVEDFKDTLDQQHEYIHLKPSDPLLVRAAYSPYLRPGNLQPHRYADNARWESDALRFSDSRHSIETDREKVYKI